MLNPGDGTSSSQLFTEELFRHAPVSLWVEDFSAVYGIIATLKESGITDFSQYFERHPEIVKKCAEAVHVLAVNQAAVDLHKAGTRHQLLKNISKTFTAQSFKVFTNELLALINQDVGFSSSTELRTLQGQSLYCVLKAYVDPNFETWSRVYIAITDLTPLKKAEQALRQSEAHFRNLYDSAPTGYQSLDKAGFYLHVNQTMLDYLGYARNDLLGRWFGDFLIPEDLPVFKKDFPLFIARGKVKCVRFRMVRKDRSILHVEFEGRTVVDSDGQFLRTHCSMRDVTDLIVLEQERAALAQQHQLVLFSVGEGILGIDVDGRINFANPGAAKITGWSVDELLGQVEHELLHHTDKVGEAISREDCPILISLREGCTTHGKSLFWRKDGTAFPVEFNCHPILVDGGFNGAVLSFNDVSEKESMERQLALSQKLESVGHLAGGLAHDFNNILQVMMGEAELSLDASSTHAEARQALGAIKEEISKASGLTRQLLAFSRKQVLDKKVINVDKLVENILRMLHRLVPENIEISFTPSAHDVQVHVDVGQIEQVLVNLCINARDAMPDGGQLKIYTDELYLDDTFLDAHPWSRKGQFARIVVADNGCGMDKETMDRVFEPFFTTKAEDSGTGLGLSTAYGIVKQHEGFINVYSEPGSGTVFRLYFPVSKSGQTSREKLSSKVQHVGGSETILVVEDNEKVRIGFTKSLKQMGYTVLQAEDGQAALQLWQECGNEIDLMILDVIMPRLNGPEVYSTVRKTNSTLPVIFCSGYGRDLLGDDLLADKNVILIEKPLGASLLLGTVRNALDTTST